MKSKFYLSFFVFLCLFFQFSSLEAQNIALAKNVVASSIESPATYASYINDAKGTGAQINPATGACTSGTCTRWSSAASDPQWVYIDLASLHNITQVTLYWEAASGQNFTIDVSNDAVSWTTVATITGNSTYVNVIPITPGTQGRYVRMNGTTRTTPFGYSLWEFEINGTIVSPLGPNRALGMVSTASSSQLPPGNAFDGQGNEVNVDYIGGCTGGPGCSFWASNNGNDPEWVYVDLGISYYISQVALYWTFFSGRDFQIQTSQDAISWTTVTTYTGNTAYANTFNLNGTSGRYVRMLGTARTTGQDYELFEFEVYGSVLALPVTLTNFIAAKQDSKSKISWTTSQEINSKEFIVEKSSNGIEWKILTVVPAQGSSSNPANYSVIDPTPAKGLNHYRLKAVDIDNRFEYSEIRKVNFDTKVAFNIYPNPAADMLKITVDNSETLNAASIQILNAQSQVLINQTANGNVQPIAINISSLVPGIYLVKIISKDGTSSIGKFIKQ